MPTYEFLKHDRFRHVCVILALVRDEQFGRIGPAQVYGHIAMLEAFAVSYHDDGDLTGLTDERIELAAGWCPPEVPPAWSGKFAQAMREAGLIHHTDDGRTQMRGWPECAPHYIRERIRKRESRGGGKAPGRRGAANESDDGSRADCTNRGTNPDKSGQMRQSRAEYSAGAVFPPTPQNGRSGGAGKSARNKSLEDAGAALAAEIDRQLWPNQPHRSLREAPAQTQVRLLALACGCDDSFAGALRRLAKKDGDRLAAALWSLLAELKQRAAPPKNPGAWVRQRLRAQEFDV